MYITDSVYNKIEIETDWHSAKYFNIGIWIFLQLQSVREAEFDSWLSEFAFSPSNLRKGCTRSF